jgi:hypothetical protein
MSPLGSYLVNGTAACGLPSLGHREASSIRRSWTNRSRASAKAEFAVMLHQRLE